MTRPPQVPTGHFANSAGCQGTVLTVLRGASGCPLRKGAQSWAVTDALFPNFGKAQSCGSPGAPCAGSRLPGPSWVATQMGTRIPLGGGGRGHHHALLRLPPCGVLLRNRVPPAWRQAQAPDADAGACRKMHSPRQCRPRGSSRGGAAFVPSWGVGLGACPLTRSPRTAPPGGPAPPSCFSGRSHPARHPYFTRDKCHRARGPARRTGFWVRPRLCFDAVSTAGAQRGRRRGPPSPHAPSLPVPTSIVGPRSLLNASPGAWSPDPASLQGSSSSRDCDPSGPACPAPYSQGWGLAGRDCRGAELCDGGPRGAAAPRSRPR